MYLRRELREELSAQKNVRNAEVRQVFDALGHGDDDLLGEIRYSRHEPAYTPGQMASKDGYSKRTRSEAFRGIRSRGLLGVKL